MRVSLNEIEVRYARAFEAMGFPAGPAQDAAGVVGWHDVWRLHGLSMLSRAVATLDGAEHEPPNVDVRDGMLRVDAGGASLLAVASYVLDHMDVVHKRSGPSEITIHRCRDTDFVVGLAGVAAERGLEAVLRSRVGGQGIAAVAGNGIGAVSLYRLPAPAAAAPHGDEIHGRTGHTDGLADAGAVPWLSRDDLASREQAAIDDGIEVDPASWQRICALGARLLVSESEDSLRRGAGGGDDRD